MRGKPLTQTPCTARARITPADAGKTTTRKAKHRTGRDHPRGCGENVYVFPCVRNKPGSPPRMRGKPLLPQNGHGLSRITPADAGKTKKRRNEIEKTKDHPRGCGENNMFWNRASQPLGSPPRMRGKQTLRLHMLCLMGITPADAGKTLNFRIWAWC